MLNVLIIILAFFAQFHYTKYRTKSLKAAIGDSKYVTRSFKIAAESEVIFKFTWDRDSESGQKNFKRTAK